MSNSSSQPPATIPELAERALDNLWDDRSNLKHFLRTAERYRREGKELAKQGDIEAAFVRLAKAATLVLEKLPTHRDYNTLLSVEQQNNLALNGQEILDNLGELKKLLIDRYDEWVKRHPDGPTPVANGKPVDDRPHQAPQPRPEDMYAAQQRRDQEAAFSQIRDQQKRVDDEARLWKAQREEAEQRELEARMRQMSMHRREEEAKHEQKVREDREAMFRRQHAADEQARAIRQNLSSSGGAYTVSSPISYEQTPLLTPTPSPHNTRPPFSYPSMPIPSSLTPSRAPVYPTQPPITTTSPPPGAQGMRVGYPQLMSPHQQSQGYAPSIGSMFTPPNSQELYSHNMLPPASAPAFQPRPQSDWSYATPPAQPPLHPFPASSIQYPAYPGPTRPQPPVPGPPPPASAPAAPPPPPPILTTSTPKTAPDAAPGLKQVTLPRECLPRFIAIAKVNTNLNKETCGLLLGVDKGHKFVVTTLLIPKQSATSDTCTMDEEELVLQFTEERGLITLGWIHTHPSQSCFMSSVDLHTHSGFQCMLPESFAVVCAPKSTPNFGIFRLTDPPGLQTILHCNAKEAFHPHPDVPIYTDADKGHVHMKSGSLEIVDLR